LRKNSTKEMMKKKKIWARKRWRVRLEPMIDYKYPTIASGATPIGSAGRAPDEKLFREERGRKFRVHELDISLPSGAQIQEPEDFGKSKNWSRRLKKLKIWRNQRFKKSKIEAFEDWRFEVWDSTRVCDSNWVSGATDEGMPFRYSQISIPGLAH
jgi:hypothetical protein